MKKMIMTLAIGLSSLAAFAGEEVNQKVLDAFKTEFSTVSEVEWSTGSNYYRAAFVYNNKHVFAYFSEEGQLLGMTRYLSSVDLPLTLQTSLRKEYSVYWISDLFEVSKDQTTTYYITLENADTRIVLQSSGTNAWELYKTIKKV